MNILYLLITQSLIFHNMFSKNRLQIRLFYLMNKHCDDNREEVKMMFNALAHDSKTLAN